MLKKLSNQMNWIENVYFLHAQCILCTVCVLWYCAFAKDHLMILHNFLHVSMAHIFIYLLTTEEFTVIDISKS